MDGMTPAQYRAIREKLGLTQTELGALLGISFNTIARRERGELPISKGGVTGLEVGGEAQKTQTIIRRAGTIAVLIVALILVSFHQADASPDDFFQFGDMPLWAQASRIYRAANNGAKHWLAEVTGCVSEEALDPSQTIQCRETFLYLRPTAHIGRGLNAISNVQVAGYAAEIKGNDSRIGTVGNGRIDRAVRYDGLCYGNVGECVGLRAEEIEFNNGWKLQSRGAGLELVAPDGTTRQTW